ncbi:MAG: Trk system potassium transporter TrkA [Deferribacteres bacterium]|nr:Trk system potassium transporter TrkA [candidate division KSB1 bacterium]MCB9509566.1 Trk system potassium transporter TrkA [Deferribacteres bacterium]
MKVIVIGMGETGKYVAAKLASEKHDIVIVDDSAANLQRAEESMDVMALLGHGASVKKLHQANAGSADLVIAVSGSNEINLLAAITAKHLGAKRAIARVDSGDYLEDDNRGFSSKLLGIDLVINTRILIANEIYKLIKSVGAIAVEDFADNRIELLEIAIDEQEKLIEKPLRELHLPENSLIAAILRDDEMIIPNGSDELLPGDEVFVVGAMPVIPKLEKIFGDKHQARAKKVVIIGGGDVGFAVARLLEREQMSILLIERDAERCQHLSNTLNRAVVLQGDGTDISVLRDEKIEQCDVFVAVSGDDETNMASSLLAKNLGAKKTLALVNKPDYVPLFELLGIDATVSPRIYAANKILKFARQEEVVSVSLLENGKAEILELIPVAGSQIVNKPLAEVNFPRGAVVAGVASADKVFVPRGKDQIAPGNTVVVLTKPEVRPAVERLCKKRLLSF